jgi:hypothetical protein
VLFVIVERLSHRGRRESADATTAQPDAVPAPQRASS